MAPTPFRRRAGPAKTASIDLDELQSLVAMLSEEAQRLEQTVPQQPGLRVQLGMLCLKDDFIKKVLKDWDAKNRGEFLKAEFRLNLRNCGLNATSAEADELFDSWDDDKGGTLDLKELKAALQKTQELARAWRDKPDPRQDRAKLQVLAQSRTSH